MMIRCVHGWGNVWPGENGVRIDAPRSHYFEENKLLPETATEGPQQGWGSMSGNRPIYFVNRTYVVERHAHVKKIVSADEAKYGTKFQKTQTSASPPVTSCHPKHPLCPPSPIVEPRAGHCRLWPMADHGQPRPGMASLGRPWPAIVNLHKFAQICANLYNV